MSFSSKFVYFSLRFCFGKDDKTVFEVKKTTLEKYIFYKTRNPEKGAKRGKKS